MIEPMANTPESGRKFWKPQLKGVWTDARYSYPFEAMVLRRAILDGPADAPTLEGYVLMRAVVTAKRLTPRMQAALGGGYQAVVQILILDRSTYTQLRVFREGKSEMAFSSKQLALKHGGSIALGTYQKLKASPIYLDTKAMKNIPLRREGPGVYRRTHRS